MMERYLLTRVLRETGGNQSLAAKMLGITRGSLRNKIRSLRLSIDHVVTVGGVGRGGRLEARGVMYPARPAQIACWRAVPGSG